MSTALRSAPGSKTDRTLRDDNIAKLAALKDRLERDAKAQHTPGLSKSARKRAAKKSGPVTVTSGATKPGSRPTLNSGSIQTSPPQVRVTRPKGMRLQPFSDYIPKTPDDYGLAKDLPRDGMDFERAKTFVRSSREVREMRANSTSGAEDFRTYDERHEDDVAAGVIRDDLGRVIRTTDMPDCEVDMVCNVQITRNDQGELVAEREYLGVRRVSGKTPREYATDAGTLGVRTRSTQAEQVRKKKRAEVDARKAERAERKAFREQAKAVRQAERAEDSEARQANREASKKMRDLAREILAKQGISKPTPTQVRGMLEFFQANMQRAEYMGNRITSGNLEVAA